jgi:curved DNA-binding protein CbpA
MISLLLFLILCVFVGMSKKTQTYYEILEVENNATQRDIRKAYFALVKLYHPDKNEQFDDTKKVRDKFEAISNAYEILSDEEKRAEYDRLLQYGQSEYKPQDQGQPQQEDRPKYKFKDPWKAYEEALQKEADEAFREKVYYITSITFGTLFTVFSGWVITKFVKRTKIYQKIEKSNQEKETRKNLVNTKMKMDKKQRKEQVKLEEQEKKRLVSKQVKLEKMSEIDEAKLTPWAVEDEEERENEEIDPTPQKPQAKAKNNSEFYCTACKKGFKSIQQWDNHENSKKHKQEANKLSAADLATLKNKINKIKQQIEQTKQQSEQEPKQEESETEPKKEDAESTE